MKARNKYVPALFQVYENDSFRDYLEAMALKGWRLRAVGSVFLHFESCKPHRIRYCVEVMEKPSAYASSQSEELKAYREFCRDAGWEYAGTTGYFHIFYTEEEEAVVVETDPAERYRRICCACQGNHWLIYGIVGLNILINLYSCYVRGTVLCVHGWVVLLMIGALAWSVGEFFYWKGKALRDLAAEGTLPCAPWAFVRGKNQAVILAILLMGAAPALWTLRNLPSKDMAWFMASFLGYVILLACICSKLLYWLKVKRAYSTRANIAIYWGVGLAVGMAACGVFLALVFRMVQG